MTNQTNMRDATIVALDVDAHEALGIARSLQGRARWLKVGMTLFYEAGPEIVRELRDMGFEIFLDLKLHDIPHQVEGAAARIARLGVGMFTVHAAGGRAMMEAAVRGACTSAEECGLDSPAVLAVTVLTSMDETALLETGVDSAPAAQVTRLATLAVESGVQGLVCSPHEAGAVRQIAGPERLIVTPGVRPSGSDHGDQARVMTPADAFSNGATHIVIGRPVTGAAQPAAAFENIVMEDTHESVE